jgi:hypothetical protein
MSIRYNFTNELWRILQNILLHEDNGDLYRVISIREVCKNTEIGRAWDKVTELFTYHTRDVVPKAKLNKFYRRL